MMKQMAGMAGMGARKAVVKARKGKGASRKGNPASRAALARGEQTKALEKAQGAAPAGQNPFGLPEGGQLPDLSTLNLPGGPGGFGLPKPPAGPVPRRRG